MDYEKLYKEALSRANKYYNANTNNGYREIFEDIFPELKESEDEKIRKEIIQSIQDNMCVIHKDKCIAWLEKRDTKLQEYINKERNKKDFYCEGKEMSWNEMPLDVRKHDYPYYFKGDLDCYPFNIEKQSKQKPIEQDTEIHDLWVYIREWNDKFGRLPKDEDELAACIDYVMKRQKPAAWSEKYIADMFEKVGLAKIVREQSNDNLTNALQHAMIELGKFTPLPKQEWSEEDEYQINTILHGLDLKRELYRKEGNQVEEKRYKTQYDWLKSLKPHWKPSEEQIKAIKFCCANFEEYDALKSLYNDLKKL